VGFSLLALHQRAFFLNRSDMKKEIKLSVNGDNKTCIVESRTLLVHFLRDELRLTGTHIGCDTSSCGACTIWVNGKSTKSCTMFAVQADHKHITTIEGLSGKDGMHPLQEAFNECHGLQCGFCTPGMIMSAGELLKENPRPSPEDIRHALEGNFCRCTGYQNIVKSVQLAAKKMEKEVAI